MKCKQCSYQLKPCGKIDMLEAICSVCGHRASFVMIEKEETLKDLPHRLKHDTAKKS